MALVDIHIFQAISVVLWTYNIVIIAYLISRNAKDWMFFIVPAVWIASNIVFYAALFAKDFLDMRALAIIDFTFWSSAIRLFGASAVAGVLTAIVYGKIVIVKGGLAREGYTDETAPH